MKKIHLPYCFGAVVVLAGLTVMAGWFFDVPALKSILSVWVTMKFTTAVCFTLSGFILWSIACEIKERECLAQVILPISTLCLFLIMFTLLASSLLGIRTGIEDLFIKENANAVNTSIPGRPSIVTMFAFCLVAAGGTITLLKPKKLKRILTVLGASVALIGSVGVLGYLFGVPALYYSVKGLSSAMACHTAILFLLLGIGLCASVKN
jgi:hypothetical protein